MVTREVSGEDGMDQEALTVVEIPAVGLSLQAFTPALAQQYGLPRFEGLLVVDVAADGAAAAASLQPGDIILEVDQRPVNNVEAFHDIIHQHHNRDKGP